ncbi:hypothetical protein FHT29_006694 [Rhizobium sp. SG741]|nr:hypothetical protein [Rhizobium sp. SG741]
MRQERQTAAEDVARLSNDVARLSARCNTIEAEAKRLEIELETAKKYEEENAIILGRLGNLRNSKSWRLTAPLRKLVDTVRPKRRI